jgi:hypothetical protein
VPRAAAMVDANVVRLGRPWRCRGKKSPATRAADIESPSVASLALLDLVLPYVLRGKSLRSFRALASALRVTSYEQAGDALGITIRGRGEFNGLGAAVPQRRLLGGGRGRRGRPGVRPGRPAARLRPRRDGDRVRAARSRRPLRHRLCQPGALASNAAFQPARAVLNALAGPTSSSTTDYPSTGLVLDLILDALSLRARRHHPAFARQSTLVPHSPRTTASRSLK